MREEERERERVLDLFFTILFLPLFRDSLFNTNTAFDWGSFRKLAQDQTESVPTMTPSLFSVRFSEPGVYVLRLNSHHNKHMVTLLYHHHRHMLTLLY